MNGTMKSTHDTLRLDRAAASLHVFVDSGFSRYLRDAAIATLR